MSFNGKVALITGSSSGIGEAIAIKLLSLGASVVITGRDESRIESVVKKCQSLGSAGRALGVRADLLAETDVHSLVRQTVKEFGKIDILVNNAGVSSMVPFGDPTYLDFYDQVFNTNVRSIQVLTQLVIPYLETTKGNIINISSMAGLVPNTVTMAYCMAKSALDMFTKCLALQLGPKGVRVNSVNPAAIRTPIYKSMSNNDQMLDLVVSICQNTYPLGRIGEPEDVATCVAYLASDGASFTTGAIIPVDGGSWYSANYSKAANVNTNN